MNRPFYIDRFLMEIGDLAIFCPFAVAHAGGHSLFIRLQGRIVQGGTHLWHFSTAQSPFFRLSSSHWVPVLASGEPSTCWKAMVTTTLVPMLMYGKEASNQKQEIDRQHHTIPNQRANDKHHGNVYNLLFRYGKVRSQNMEKLKSSFPTFCKRTFPQLHKIASYAHYAQCRLLRKPSHFIIYSRK